jgi:hypothetical protein
LPGTVQRQYRLLLAILHRNKTHAGPAHRFTNRFGIRHVVLIRLDVGLHEQRCHQLYGMSELLQLPHPVMRAATCLYPNQARCDIRKERQYLIALELLSEYRPAVFVTFVYTVHLDKVLC